MNLLSLVHSISEQNLTVFQVRNLITESIDSDSSTPIDGWDMSATVTLQGHPPVNNVDSVNDWTISKMAVMLDEWGYRVLLQCDGFEGPQVEIHVVLTFSGGDEPATRYMVNGFHVGCLNDYESGPFDTIEDAREDAMSYIEDDEGWEETLPGERWQKGTFVIRIEEYEGVECAAPDVDDDPRCVCGSYLSEHALCGCPEGFQTAASWARESEGIRQRAQLDASGFDIYEDETDDQYYQSQGSYYCKHGVYVGSPGGADYMCGRCEMGD